MQGQSQPDRVRQVLSDLESLRENLLALSDDIWLSIDHNDQQALEEGFEFKRAYNEKLNAFDQIAEEISSLIQQFTEVELEPEVTDQPVEQQREERERTIRELDRSEPHNLHENFTYKRPFGYTLHETAHKDVVTWKRLYQLVCRQLASYDLELFRSLPERPEFVSSRGNLAFSYRPDGFLSPIDIGHGVYAEAHMSANSICDRIGELLTVFGIDHDDIKIYLREDRDARTD